MKNGYLLNFSIALARYPGGLLFIRRSIVSGAMLARLEVKFKVKTVCCFFGECAANNMAKTWGERCIVTF